VTTTTLPPFKSSTETVLTLSSEEGYHISVRLEFGKPLRLSQPGPFDGSVGRASACPGTNEATDLVVPFRVETTNETTNFPLVLGAGFSRVGSTQEMGPNEMYVQTRFSGSAECRPLTHSLSMSPNFGFVADHPSRYYESVAHEYNLIVKNVLTPNDPTGSTLSENGFGCNGRAGFSAFNTSSGFMRIGDHIFSGRDCRLDHIFKLN
jgi:hypothetical protein